MTRDRQRRWAVAVGAASIIAATPAHAADTAAPPPGRLPAVSGLNGKVELQGGYQQGDGSVAGAGSLTAPLGEAFGAQADGYVGAIDGDFVAGTAGHLFWRDPDIALFGLYGSYVHSEKDGGLDLGRVGPEGEIYLGRLTLSGAVGAQLGGDAREDVYGAADLAYYPTDDLRLSLGYRFDDAGHGGAVGAEYQVYSSDGMALSLFGEGRASEDDAGGWAGVRLYFGSDKPLIRRHREDDPPGVLGDDLFSLTAGHRTEHGHSAPPPPTPGGNGGNGNGGTPSGDGGEE